MIMKLVDIKDNITSKQKLLLGIVCLLLIIVVFSVLKNVTSKNDKAIDYKTADEYTFLIASSEESDRDVYWTLNKIVYEYLSSYQNSYNSKIKGFDYYYGALDPDYKKYLGKKKYLTLSKNLIKKVLGDKADSQDDFYILPEPLITKVNKLNNYDNAYFCEISTLNEGENAYIGIILDTEKSKYNIFYIY